MWYDRPMWPFKSRNSQAREVTELRDELARLKTDFNALARDVLDLNQSVDRWMRRDRMRATREAGSNGGTTAQGDTEVSPRSPPSGLRGVRLRRWLRAQHPPNAVDVSDVRDMGSALDPENGG